MTDDVMCSSLGITLSVNTPSVIQISDNLWTLNVTVTLTLPNSGVVTKVWFRVLLQFLGELILFILASNEF